MKTGRMKPMMSVMMTMMVTFDVWFGNGEGWESNEDGSSNNCGDRQ